MVPMLTLVNSGKNILRDKYIRGQLRDQQSKQQSCSTSEGERSSIRLFRKLDHFSGNYLTSKGFMFLCFAVSS
jgi:hypothetical protein